MIDGDIGDNTAPEAAETGLEETETVETELVRDESERELYTGDKAPDEYESELTGASREEAETEACAPVTETFYNKDGEPVDEVPIVTDERFMTETENYARTGIKTIDWNSFAENATDDGLGFDKDVPVTEKELPPDMVIVRWGSERGRNGTSAGTQYSEVSLPYDEKTIEYHEYRIIGPVKCKAGIVARNFGQKGGGDQYLFSDTFAEMANPNNPNRSLERIR